MSTSTVGSQPINSLIQQPNQQAAPVSSNSVMGQDAFLQLLTTELQNQDPLQPMDDTQSVAQLAQFSALQAQNDLKTSFENFQSNFGVLQTSSLIGKKVTVGSTDSQGNSSSLTGTVSTIAVQNGQPYFTMTDSSGNTVSQNGQPVLFSTSQIVGIG